MTTIAATTNTQAMTTKQPATLRPIEQAPASKLRAAHLGKDQATVSGRRGSLPMKPVVIGSLAATATAVILGGRMGLTKPGGFGPVGTGLVTAALFSPSNAVASSAAFADSAAQGLVLSAAVGALSGVVMGGCSGQIIRGDLKQSLAKAGAYAVVGAASALVGAITSRAVAH